MFENGQLSNLKNVTVLPERACRIVDNRLADTVSGIRPSPRSQQSLSHPQVIHHRRALILPDVRLGLNVGFAHQCEEE
jgi:hypothetical protein